MSLRSRAGLHFPLHIPPTPPSPRGRGRTHDLPERSRRDLQIEPDRPVRDVIKIPIHAPVEHLALEDLAPVPEALREPGDPRLHEMARPVAARLRAELLVQEWHVGPRADHAHV